MRRKLEDMGFVLQFLSGIKMKEEMLGVVALYQCGVSALGKNGNMLW